MSGNSNKNRIITLRLPVEVLEKAEMRVKKWNQYNKMYENTRDHLEEILIRNITRGNKKK